MSHPPHHTAPACTTQHLHAPSNTCMHQAAPACTTQHLHAPHSTCMHHMHQAAHATPRAPHSTCLHQEAPACTKKHLHAPRSTCMHQEAPARTSQKTSRHTHDNWASKVIASTVDSIVVVSSMPHKLVIAVAPTFFEIKEIFYFKF